MEKWVLRSLICAGKSFWKFQIVTRYRELHYFYTTCMHISLKEFWLVLCKNWAESVFRIALSYKFHNNIYRYIKNINMGKFGVFYSIFFVLFFVFCFNSKSVVKHEFYYHSFPWDFHCTMLVSYENVQMTLMYSLVSSKCCTGFFSWWERRKGDL